MSYRPRNRVKTKKKGLHRNLGLNSAGFCRIYSCFQALFRLLNQRSNLNGGTLNLNGGTLTLEGGRRPSYNLSTGLSISQQNGNDSEMTVCCSVLRWQLRKFWLSFILKKLAFLLLQFLRCCKSRAKSIYSR